jgi:hypothetical protein
MPVIATPGAANANSFLTILEADAYHAARLHNDEWSAATELQKEAALLWATRILDRHSWVGRRTNELQRLRWPRTGVYDQDDFWVHQDVVPSFLKDATAELALLLLRKDRTAEAETTGLSKIVVGPIELEMDPADTLKDVSPEVWRMIQAYLDNQFSLSRG